MLLNFQVELNENITIDKIFFSYLYDSIFDVQFGNLKQFNFTT